MSPETVKLLNVIVQILIALGVIATIGGIVTGIVLLATSSGQPEPKKKHNYQIWGIVAIVGPIIFLFVLLSLWGLFRILTNTFAA